MIRTAFVTGADGFIGSHLVTFLQSKQWNVVGGRRFASKRFHSSPNVKFVTCDLTNKRRVREIVEQYRPTHIFHLGAQSLPTRSWIDPVSTFESNIMGSLYLFEAVRRMKSPALVISACSSAEYGPVKLREIPVTEEHPLRPLHPYGISKVCLDLLAREYFLNHAIPIVNLRLFNTTGPGKANDAPSDFIRQLSRIRSGLQEPVIEVGNLTPRRAFLDVRDAVHGFYLAALRGRHGEAYNLCAPTIHSIRELLRISIRLSNLDVSIRPVKKLMRPADEKIIFGSTQKLRKQTGWKPTVGIEQTLRSMLKYWDHHFDV